MKIRKEMDILLLHNSNGELQTHLRSPSSHGIKDIPEYFQKHFELFKTHQKSSDNPSYIQAYKHTIEILLINLDADTLLDNKIIEFLTLCQPAHLFALCIHILKKPDKTVLTYQNSLTLLLYTLQPTELAKVITSNIHICGNTPISNQIAILNPIQTSFIQNLCSIPDLVMNKLAKTLVMVESNKDYKQSPIYPENFYTLISQVIFCILIKSTDNSDIFILFFASLLNQICLLGNATIIARFIIQFVNRKAFAKLDILKAIISKILPRGLEKLLESLLTQYYTPKFGNTSIFSKFLLDPRSSTRVKTVLIDRLIISRQFSAKQNLLLHNLMHYICNEASELGVEVLETVLTAFKSEFYVDRISLEQHEYLCRVIILCVRYYTIRLEPDHGYIILQAIKDGNPNRKEDEVSQIPKICYPKIFPNYPLLLLTQNAIEIHLKNTRTGIKIHGQVIGEILCAWLNNDPSNTLNFGLPSNDHTVMELRNLLTSQHEKPIVTEYVDVTMDDSNSFNFNLIPELQKMFEPEKPNEIVFSETNTISADEIDALILPNTVKPDKPRPLIEILSDSDNSESEDLKPFPSTIDTPSQDTKSYIIGMEPIPGPYSLRECVEWLGTNVKSSNEVDNVKRIDAALNKVESFIRASPHDLKIWTGKLAEIFLNISNEYSIKDMHILRLNSLVALCVCNPVETAKYLTAEFYTLHIVMHARFDILVSIERAAGELANISESKTTHTHFKIPLTKYQQTKKQPKVWEDIIKERLKLKTRIISSARKQAKITENVFGDVVGYFFYPLLYNFDKSLATMNFFGDDVWLFCALLKTIGSLIIYAQGTIALRKMTSALFEFLIAIKTVGNSLVKQDLSPEMEELTEYLQDIFLKDADQITLRMSNDTLHQISLLYKQWLISMIRRYETSHDYPSFHSNEHTVSLALVGEIKQALLNHNFKFILDATAYLLILFTSARELVRSCVLLSSTYNHLPKNIVEMILARIERKSMLIESPVLIPLSIERTMYFLDTQSWNKAGNCAITHLDKSLKHNPLLKTYAGLTHYILWQKDKLYDAESTRKGMKIGKSNTHQQRIKDILKYLDDIYANKGVWDIPLHLHMKLLIEERNDIQSALNIAKQNLDSNKGDLNALVTLAIFYIDFNESDFYNRDELISILTRIHYIDPSNYLMISLCQETGISEENSNFIVSIAMEFLDYPCNKDEHLMWECLYGALTELSNSVFEKVLAEEWADRRSWWIPLHFDIDNLIQTFTINLVLSCYKALVLNTLNWGGTNPYTLKAKMLLDQLTDVDYNLECISKLVTLVVGEFIPEEKSDDCIMLDFSKDLTDESEEIGITDDVELIPVPLAKKTKFFQQEDLAAYCYISDQCLVKQEIERLFYLRRYKAMGPPNNETEPMESDNECSHLSLDNNGSDSSQ
ncbi:Telomere length regulation protein TEL2-like [Oopsacas minuta]|uniref:Telomere length regulation protein TEL2-like n=1 Tax=Oopsacas minuta TaxID=111878 RepID=A0AAV7JTM2_9METZ|nr:Telomere length regulation protein TEL2-like [Oopsacas minuta]